MQVAVSIEREPRAIGVCPGCGLPICDDDQIWLIDDRDGRWAVHNEASCLVQFFHLVDIPAVEFLTTPIRRKEEG